jgi:tetratricopeptide (TPR) repeat protein
VSKRFSGPAVAVAVATLGSISLALVPVTAVAQDAAQPAAAAAACTGDGEFSKPIRKTMSAAQEAAKAKNWPEVVTKLAEAEADTKPKTDFDQFWIRRFRGNAYTSQKQYAEAVKEFEAIADSPCMKAAEKPEHLRLITRIYAQLEDYPKVIEFGNRVLQMGPDADISSYVAQSYYLNKDYAGAKRIMTEVINEQEKQGKSPTEQELRILQGACTQTKDDACAVQQFERLVKYHPKPEHWQNLIILLSQDPKSTDKQQLNVMRLAQQVDVLKQGRVYAETAQIALDQGLPGEAQSIIERGFEQNLFTDKTTTDLGKRLLAAAKAAAAIDKASLAQQDASARANKAGNADVKLGAAYLSYGDSAKAIEALQRGITKGGVKDADEAGILLGIAHLRAGNKPEAAKAFSAVNGDPLMTRLAKLWLLNT